MSKDIAEFLRLEIRYAKTCDSARDMLFQTYGQILMARYLDAITHDEYMELNGQCVRGGINNPEFFRDKKREEV